MKILLIRIINHNKMFLKEGFEKVVKNPFNKLVNKGREATQCSLCYSEFGQIINRPHQCKRCQLFICSDCGKNKMVIYKMRTTV